MKRPCCRSLTMLALSSLWLLTARGDDANTIRFKEQLIADQYGYTFGVAALDLDGDHDLDLTNVDIVGKNPSSASLLWFENNGRGVFQRHLIHGNENAWFERHSVGDINGDRRPDIAVVSNRDGHLLWFANREQPGAGPWKRNVITTNCKGAYDVVLCDLDGDGDVDAAAAGYVGNAVTWYENPGPEGWDREWTRRVIDDQMPENRTIRPGDFNRDGKIDLLAASVGIANSPADATSAAQHGSSVVWYENSGRPADQPWKKHVIDERTRAPIHGHPGDLDGDGDLDVVMAFGMRGEFISEEKHEVAWYENVGQPGDATHWRRHLVSPLPCAFEAIAADLDGDGDQDLAATAWSKGDRLVWFENSGDPRGKWTMHILKEQWYAANQVIAADLDGDGRLDLAGTADDGSRRVKGANELRWWRNEGRRGK